MKEIKRKGFTLIELLIVIAILGVLAAAVTIVLNPAELLAQARDGQRISDMDTIRTAVNTFLSQTTSSTIFLDSMNYGLKGACSASSGTNTPFATTTACTDNATRAVDGTGWVDVNLASLPAGSPLATLPLDPINSGSYVYAYVGNATTTSPNYTFKLSTRLESVKFKPKMTLFSAATNTPGTCSTGVESQCWYQTGTNLAL